MGSPLYVPLILPVPEMFVFYHNTTWCHNPEDLDFYVFSYAA